VRYRHPRVAYLATQLEKSTVPSKNHAIVLLHPGRSDPPEDIRASRIRLSFSRRSGRMCHRRPQSTCAPRIGRNDQRLQSADGAPGLRNDRAKTMERGQLPKHATPTLLRPTVTPTWRAIARGLYRTDKALRRLSGWKKVAEEHRPYHLRSPDF